MVVYNMQSKRLEILEENYREIVNLMNKIDLPQEKFNKLKSNFKDQIDSVRRYDNINTMRDLLKILETRCVIGFDNIGKLYAIAEEVEDELKPQLGKLLIGHSRWLFKSGPVSVNLAHCINKEPHSNLPQFSLPSTVVDYISSQIRMRWKHFARALQIIKEKNIDTIEILDDDNKTKKCLVLFMHEAELQRLSNPYQTLLNALEVIGRRDVKEGVENLLIHNFKERR